MFSFLLLLTSCLRSSVHFSPSRSGDIPNLFETEELEPIINKLRPLAKKLGRSDAREALLQLFNHNVRENLHIVLTFSPVGSAFRDRLRSFPSLVNCCTIDWYQQWPDEALFAVAQRFLSASGAQAAQDASGGAAGGPGAGPGALELNIPDPFVANICHVCVKIHATATEQSRQYLEQTKRHNYVTPTSYLELVRLYSEMLVTQRDAVSEKIARYRTGLTRLANTDALVTQLEKDLIKLQPVLKKSSEDTLELLTDLTREQKEVNETRVVCQKEAEETEKQTAEVAAISQQCQAELDDATPMMDAAMKALDVLTRDHINTLKVLPHPPKNIEFLMSAVCMLFDLPGDWDSAKRLLSRPNFITMCREYPKDNIPSTKLKKLQKYINDKDFKPERMESASKVAVSLCMWVIALDVYARVFKQVEPKRVAYQKAKAVLEQAQATLASKQMQLRIVEARVSGLQQRFKAKSAERDDIEQSMKRTQAQLVRAQKLTRGLESEKGRWNEQANLLQLNLNNLLGDMLLSAGCVAYLGAFNAEFRAKLMADWTKFCIQSNAHARTHPPTLVFFFFLA